ncbi:MAG: M48 family metalloprotease [Sulfurovum sp.]|nr:M48 family metalloprotease [Sulfurovum sp.]
MILGHWYEAGSAASQPATLSFAEDGVYKLELYNTLSYVGYTSTLKISPRLGNVERKITFTDLSLFTTDDNDAIDQYFSKHHKAYSLLHTLESHMGLVLIALLVTVLSTGAFFKWGVPWSSKKIAHALPEKTNQLIAENSMDFLDKYLFEDSNLSVKKKEQIQTYFYTNVAPLGTENKEIKYKLHFRDWSDGSVSIPNALALPSGDIILTDKFVELCKTQDEMDAVLLHEMGHVVHRHTLEMVIEGTFVSVAVMLIVGDSNGIADMGIGLGSVLMSSAYSRGHESEADSYAFKHMLAAHIDPASFSHIMTRMTEYMEGAKIASKDKEDGRKKEEKDILDYLSSHPNTKERIEIANQYSACFKRGLEVCDVKGVK